MAYLYKHTPLQSTFPVNLTCLVPTENPIVGKPERLELHEILWHFLHFRLEVVRARLKHELEALKTRIHILEGFETVFDALDEILKIVRKSEGKADAAEKIMKRFEPRRRADRRDPRAEDLPPRAARDPRHPEGAGREAQAREGDRRPAQARRGSLEDRPRARSSWSRRPTATPAGRRSPARWSEEEYTADDFIIEEDNVVIVTRDGWVKRQKEVKDIASTRVREGDAVLAVLPGSTRATVVFFTNFGVAYTTRIADVPASTGYGEPIQSLFKFKDGEKVVAALSLDLKKTPGLASSGRNRRPKTRSPRRRQSTPWR